MSDSYPLKWPAGWPRAKTRGEARFSKKRDTGRGYSATEKLTVANARDRLGEELDLMKARYPTLSTNVELRLDGQPRSGQTEPTDTGVAVYFQLNGKPIALACDRWNRVADNIAAIAAHIGALRGMDRWGVGTAEQMFAGYEALPAPEQWWQVLGVAGNASVAEIDAKFRELAMTAHPDRGGSDAAMTRLNAARAAGLKAIDG